MKRDSGMLRIGIGLSFYNDFESLKRMLTSLQSYPIDTIIAIDGKYKELDTPNLYSNDDVLDLLESFQTKVYSYQVPGYDQITKRNMYFELSQDHDLDVLIVMDSDDFIVHDKTNWPLFIEDLEQKIEGHNQKPESIQSYCIPVRGYYIQSDRNDVVDSDQSLSANILRVFYKPWELEYYGTHYKIRNKQTYQDQCHSSNTTCSNIMLGHDHALRSNDDLRVMMEYEKIQTKKEQEGVYASTP